MGTLPSSDSGARMFRKYHMELLRFGVHVLHDQGLAEEMVQETFIKFAGRPGTTIPAGDRSEGGC